MKERGIIMGAKSVRAMLKGEKWQTRRVMKPQPPQVDPAQPFRLAPRVSRAVGSYSLNDYDRLPKEPGEFTVFGAVDYVREHCGQTEWRCPYGIPGDRLWVRETWRQGVQYCTEPSEPPLVYRATAIDDGWTDDPDDVWKSPLFMPRVASRLTLEITRVWAERLQDISDEDAIAEGYRVKNPDVWYTRIDDSETPHRAYHLTGERAAFAATWDVLNDRRGFGWPVNPWLWVVSFRVVDRSRNAET